MARRNLRIALWSALTRRLQTWADLAHRQAEKARLAAEKSADEQPADGAVERQPGEPPAHWLERAGRSGPPDHWLEHVRERAPHLLDDDQLQVEPLVAAQPPAPARPAPGRQPEAAQSAIPRTGPLRLIPRAKPAEEPAMEKTTVEEPATKEPLAAPVAREQQPKKQPPAIRLEPQPAETPKPTSPEPQPAPIEEQATPQPARPAPFVKKAIAPPPPSRPQRPPVESVQEIVTPRLEVKSPVQPMQPPQERAPQPSREPRPPTIDATTPQSPSHQTKQPGERVEVVRWMAFEAEPIPVPPVATPEQQPQEEASQPRPRRVRVAHWPRKEAPVKLQRLEREQRGHLWNESLF